MKSPQGLNITKQIRYASQGPTPNQDLPATKEYKRDGGKEKGTGDRGRERMNKLVFPRNECFDYPILNDLP